MGKRRLLALALALACAVTLALPIVRAQDGVRTPHDATHWYAFDPHVPLARVLPARAGDADGGAIESAPRSACRAWADVGATWTAVDRWGQIVGPTRLRRREYYYFTRCYETGFDADVDASRGRAVLFARGRFQAPASMRWSPSSSERQSYAQFVGALSRMMLVRPAGPPRADIEPPVPSAPPLFDRTLFFRFRDPGFSTHGERAPDRTFAVSGGPMLIVAERIGDRWVALHVLNDLANRDSTNELPYRPIAVFDMNGDGRPEIVYHDREFGGEFYGDAVISLDRHDRWHEAARSFGGSTA